MKRTRAVLLIFLAALIGAVGVACAGWAARGAAATPDGRRPVGAAIGRNGEVRSSTARPTSGLAFAMEPHRERRLERRLAGRGRVDAGHRRAAGIPLRR